MTCSASAGLSVRRGASAAPSPAAAPAMCGLLVPASGSGLTASALDVFPYWVRGQRPFLVLRVVVGVLIVQSGARLGPRALSTVSSPALTPGFDVEDLRFQTFEVGAVHQRQPGA